MAVPPKILGSCARTEVPSRVKGMWKMQDERELKKISAWKRKKKKRKRRKKQQQWQQQQQKKKKKKLRRKVFNSLRHLRSTKDVLFSASSLPSLFLIVENFRNCRVSGPACSFLNIFRRTTITAGTCCVISLATPSIPSKLELPPTSCLTNSSPYRNEMDEGYSFIHSYNWKMFE